MYQIGEEVWAIIHHTDTPKRVIIKDIFLQDPDTQYAIPIYVVTYKNREFNVVNQDVYPTQIDAEIYWALSIKQYIEYTLKNQDLFATDEYEIANKKADKIVQKYANQAPHLLLKYF